MPSHNCLSSNIWGEHICVECSSYVTTIEHNSDAQGLSRWDRRRWVGQTSQTSSPEQTTTQPSGSLSHMWQELHEHTCHPRKFNVMCMLKFVHVHNCALECCGLHTTQEASQDIGRDHHTQGGSKKARPALSKAGRTKQLKGRPLHGTRKSALGNTSLHVNVREHTKYTHN